MNLREMQVIAPDTHGVLDYMTGALLLAAPNLFRFDKLRGPAVQTPRVVGSLILVQAALTDYKYGLLRVIPFPMHLALDWVIGPFLALSPFLFGFYRRRRRAWLPHIAAGLFALVTTALTRPAPSGRGDKRVAEMLERDRSYGRFEREPAERSRMPAGTSLE